MATEVRVVADCAYGVAVQERRCPYLESEAVVSLGTSKSSRKDSGVCRRELRLNVSQATIRGVEFPLYARVCNFGARARVQGWVLVMPRGPRVHHALQTSISD